MSRVQPTQVEQVRTHPLHQGNSNRDEERGEQQRSDDAELPEQSQRQAVRVAQVAVGIALLVVGRLVVPLPDPDDRRVGEVVECDPPKVVALASGREDAREVGAPALDRLELVDLLAGEVDRVSGRKDAAGDEADRPDRQSHDRDSPRALEVPDRRPQAAVEESQQQPDDQGVDEQEGQRVGRARDVAGGHRAGAVLERPVCDQQRPREHQHPGEPQEREERAPDSLGAEHECHDAPYREAHDHAARLSEKGEAEAQHRAGECGGPERRVPPARHGETDQRPEREGEEGRGGVSISHRAVEAARHEQLAALDVQPYQRDDRYQGHTANERVPDGSHLAGAGHRHQPNGRERGVEHRQAAALEGEGGRLCPSGG